MNELLQTFPAELGHHWEWFASSSFKATAWLILVLAVLQLLRKSSAGWRHLIAVCGAIGIPLIFMLNLSAIPERHGWQPFARRTVAKVEVGMMRAMLSEHSGGSAPSGVAAVEDPTVPSYASGSTEVKIGMIALWCLGCCIVGVRFLLRLRRPQLSLLADAPDELKQLLNRECTRLNLRKTPTLQLAPDAMPMVYGLMGAVIVLPTGAIHWPAEKLIAVLRHELAHFQRRDVVWSVIVEAALLVLWWHPLARILRRQTLEWMEQACDDAVINSGIAPTQYATHLLSLSHRNSLKSVSAYGLAALSSGGQEVRFRRVLDEDRSRVAVASTKAAGTCLLALALLIPGTLLVSCSTVPKDTPTQQPLTRTAPPVKIPSAPGDASQIRLAVKIFEINFPSEEEREKPGISRWLDGEAQLLSSEEGSGLFDPGKPGTDILSAPQIVVAPGREAKLEVGNQVPLSDQPEPAFAKVGIAVETLVWPTGDTDILKVNVLSSVTEVTGYEADDTGFRVPQLRRLEGKYQGLLQNGSYLLIGQRTQPIDVDEKIPLLGDVPLLGRLFQSSKTSQKQKVIAAHFSFTELP
jgi:beta-lactamase regulating signal transducer with metallopeptidase domain